nr:MAG TPA: hypothetical protein [Caudoviricetes sp.]
MNRCVIRLNEQDFCVEYTVLQDVPEGWMEVPYELYPETTGQKFDPVNMCWLNEYADWYKAPPKPALSEAEQRELDRDEMLLDNLISNQQIILLLESGGDRV